MAALCYRINHPSWAEVTFPVTEAQYSRAMTWRASGPWWRTRVTCDLSWLFFQRLNLLAQWRGSGVWRVSGIQSKISHLASHCLVARSNTGDSCPVDVHEGPETAVCWSFTKTPPRGQAGVLWECRSGGWRLSQDVRASSLVDKWLEILTLRHEKQKSCELGFARKYEKGRRWLKKNKKQFFIEDRLDFFMSPKVN